MNRFEKVSFEQFLKALRDTCSEEMIITEQNAREVYEQIKLPQRATNGSAAYDFYTPVDLEIGYSHLLIPTGIRWVCNNPTQVLLIMPRSGQGSKYGVGLRNTVAVIDSDYHNAKNEGHIFLKINSEEPCSIDAGMAFAQGLIMQVGYVDNDITPERERVGGFGSTTEAKH